MADTAVIVSAVLCIAWQENIYSDATSRFRNYLHNPSPRIVAPGWRGEVGNYRVGTGGGARAGDVGTITLLNDPVTASYSPASGRLPQG